VSPVLDPDPATEPGVVVLGDVAGGEHAGGGLEAGVDQDAAVAGQAGGPGEVVAGGRPDADHDEVAGDTAAVGEADHRSVAVGLDRLHP